MKDLYWPGIEYLMPNSSAALLTQLYLDLNLVWQGVFPFLVAPVLCLLFYLAWDPVGKKKNVFWLIFGLGGFVLSWVTIYLWLMVDEGVLMIVSLPEHDYAGHEQFCLSFGAIAAVYCVVTFTLLSFVIRRFSTSNVWTPPIGIKK